MKGLIRIFGVIRNIYAKSETSYSGFRKTKKNEKAIEMKVHLECMHCFSCAQFMLRQMHWPNLSVSVEAEFLGYVSTFNEPEDELSKLP